MKALIAMSGGVDSSVAAKIISAQGYDCIGCTMKLYSNEDACISRSRTCCSAEDVEDARSVVYKLGIPYYVFNFTRHFFFRTSVCMRDFGGEQHCYSRDKRGIIQKRV